MLRDCFIDASLGDALLPFDALAQYAFKASKPNLNRYMVPTIHGADKERFVAVLKPISKYFTERGFVGEWGGVSVAELMVTGGGTTEGFDLIMELIDKNVQQENQNRVHEIKPVLLMPVPTYGLFKNPAIARGFEIQTIKRDLSNGGRLRPEDLDAAIVQANEEGKRVVAYYDSNPHNPLGLVRQEQETKELAEIFDKHNKLYADMDREAEYHHDMARFWSNKAGSSIQIIDDMIYDGLQFGLQAPYSFAQIKGIARDTFVLAGPSKAGATNIRSGVVRAHDEFIISMRQIQSYRSYSPSDMAMHAAQGYFSLDDQLLDMREQHLERSKKQYRFLGCLMKALINGLYDIADDQEMDLDIERMIDLVAQHKDIDREQAFKRLEQGVDHLRVITTPQAGFFHLIDFSDLRGKSYARKFEDHIGSERPIEIKDEVGLHDVFRAINVSFASGSWTGLDREEMCVRASFAMPAEVIVELVDRLEAAVEVLKSDNQDMSLQAPSPAKLL